MMGHIVDTYNDVQSKGVEFLRNIYDASGLTIKPKLNVSKIDTIKEIIRVLGGNPEEILAKDAHFDGNTTKNEDLEEHQLAVLGQELKRLIKTEKAV
jgi:hypothetical protein